MTDGPLAGHLAPLAQEGLDVERSRARDASDVLGGFLGDLHDWHIGLEEAANALERSASTRAAAARDHLGLALNSCNDVICSVADAQDAFNFHWNREPTP